MLAVLIDPRTVASYFDARAPTWDSLCKTNPEKLAAILDYADIRPGNRVLDVGCGTGVLFTDYLRRGVQHITGVDISRNMLDIARGKYPDERIELLHLDIERVEFDRLFDRVMVFNALPHFPSPERLTARLARFTEPGGRLTIAHDIGRERLNSIHQSRAEEVSLELMREKELTSILSPFFTVDVIRADEWLYLVSGVRKKAQGF